MEKRDYLNILFDYYGNLLTDKEIDCFKSYYDDDFSLSEIASDNDVSRSAIHKTIKIVEEKLNTYEDKLGMYKRYNKVIDLVNNKLSDVLIEELKNIL